MKIDHRENCEHRFSSISINFISIVNDLQMYRFLLFISISVKNAMDKRFALFKRKGKELKENF